MYKIPARTLFAGKNLVYVPQCHSTNTLAGDLGQKVETPEGTVVVTSEQTAGKGQRGNSWESQPFANLTFSLLLKPRFLAPKDQFQLNQAIATGITDYISGRVTQHVAIKWPNDILITGKKVCGVLIENHISGDRLGLSVIGIGLNMNQRTFQNPNASSLGILSGREFDLNTELATLLEDLEARYLELKGNGFRQIDNDYLDRLYRKDELHTFTENDHVFKGTIKGIGKEGKLRVEVNGKEKEYGVKEIGFV